MAIAVLVRDRIQAITRRSGHDTFLWKKDDQWLMIISSSKNGYKATSRSAKPIRSGRVPWHQLKKKRSPRRKISTAMPRSTSSASGRRATVRRLVAENLGVTRFYLGNRGENLYLTWKHGLSRRLGRACVRRFTGRTRQRSRP